MCGISGAKGFWEPKGMLFDKSNLARQAKKANAPAK
jgi:hypothetical protein